MSEPLIIMSAPNGARRQKTDHPALPITPVELAQCAGEIAEAGASILHLHVRDANNAHSLDTDRYQDAIAAIRQVVGDQLIIQVTTEAVGQYSRAQQIQMVKDLKPEAVSLALREICPDDHALQEANEFFVWLKTEKIFPQYILYDEVDIARFQAYLARGVFEQNAPFVLLVVGRFDNGLPANKMMALAKNLKCPWAMCGFAAREFETVSCAANNMGHIRVGFENNIWRDTAHLLSGHAEMIHTCCDAAQQVGRPIASAQDVRAIFQL